jgi:bifunctional UDP-N-acetylglucosamine pyrophosphorylase/glucosamine-1-phosphate N-acetyltransferase
MTTTAVLLAAGQGTRMHSSLPKVMHSLLGQPMLHYILEAASQVTSVPPVVVIGHGAESIEQTYRNAARFVTQDPQLGTGHAVQQCETLLKGVTDQVLVMLADMPLLTRQTLSAVIQAQEQHSGPLTMLTLMTSDPRGFGRIVRAPGGSVKAIVEEAQATPEQLEIRELNASVYCFSAEWLWDALRRIPLSPKGEYYLTDVVGVAVTDGLPIQALALKDSREAIGINTRVHLAEASAILRGRINQDWMLNGVTMIDPTSTYVESDVTIGQDTILWPNTYLEGNTSIGKDCIIGPNAILKDTQIGDRCKIVNSVLESAQLEDDVDVGPYSHLRKGARLAHGVHIGNFGEVKNASLGPGVKMGHFSYIGDATIGSQANIGAGTITCNYDGEKKHHTEIGAGAFIGSDTMLVAPVTLGEGSRTAAGSVVTKDVPANTLAVGVPARNIRKLEKRD